MNLTMIAEEVVSRIIERLPADIREAAAECQLILEDDPESEEMELLGLFEGLDRRCEPTPDPEDWPRITLFLQNIWDEVEGDPAEFRDEVRLTYLHELGHYLGLDEAQVEALGLA